MNLIAQTLADGLVLGGIYALCRRRLFADLRRAARHQSQPRHPGADRRLPGADLLQGAATSTRCSPCRWSWPCCSAIGYVYQRFLIQHAVDRSPLGSMLLTFGVALMLQNIMIWVFSPDMKNITPSWAFTSFQLGAVNFDAVRVSALLASLVLLCCLALLLKFSAARPGHPRHGAADDGGAAVRRERAARLCAHLRRVGSLRRRGRASSSASSCRSRRPTKRHGR